VKTAGRGITDRLFNFDDGYTGFSVPGARRASAGPSTKIIPYTLKLQYTNRLKMVTLVDSLSAKLGKEKGKKK
jgi:hypothetical protein